MLGIMARESHRTNEKSEINETILAAQTGGVKSCVVARSDPARCDCDFMTTNAKPKTTKTKPVPNAKQQPQHKEKRKINRQRAEQVERSGRTGEMPG